MIYCENYETLCSFLRVKPGYYCSESENECLFKTVGSKYCPVEETKCTYKRSVPVYPALTYSKQLELIKYLIRDPNLIFDTTYNNKTYKLFIKTSGVEFYAENSDFTEALFNLILKLCVFSEKLIDTVEIKDILRKPYNV